jgi:uncharacterized protein (DUF1015 family)
VYNDFSSYSPSTIFSRLKKSCYLPINAPLAYTIQTHGKIINGVVVRIPLDLLLEQLPQHEEVRDDFLTEKIRLYEDFPYDTLPLTVSAPSFSLLQPERKKALQTQKDQNGNIHTLFNLKEGDINFNISQLSLIDGHHRVKAIESIQRKSGKTQYCLAWIIPDTKNLTLSPFFKAIPAEFFYSLQRQTSLERIPPTMKKHWESKYAVYISQPGSPEELFGVSVNELPTLTSFMKEVYQLKNIYYSANLKDITPLVLGKEMSVFSLSTLFKKEFLQLFDRLPAKSTYFSPKPLAGFLVSSLV